MCDTGKLRKTLIALKPPCGGEDISLRQPREQQWKIISDLQERKLFA